MHAEPRTVIYDLRAMILRRRRRMQGRSLLWCMAPVRRTCYGHQARLLRHRCHLRRQVCVFLPRAAWAPPTDTRSRDLQGLQQPRDLGLPAEFVTQPGEYFQFTSGLVLLIGQHEDACQVQPEQAIGRL